MENSGKITEKLTAMNKENTAAIENSGEVLTSGAQDILKTLGERTQSQIDLYVSTWTAMTKVKSLKEATELQNHYAKTIFENAVTDGNKLMKAWVELGQQSMKPIGLRMRAVAEAIGHPTT